MTKLTLNPRFQLKRLDGPIISRQLHMQPRSLKDRRGSSDTLLHADLALPGAFFLDCNIPI